MTALPAMERSTHEIEIDSTLLGPLSVPVEQSFTFGQGIPGLPEARSFALLSAEREGFYWLQSLDSAALTFLLIDPFRFVDGYSVDLTPTELGVLTPDDPADILVLSILTLPKKPEDPATANLQGPLAFNVRLRQGKQVILESPYGLRYPVALRKKPEQD
ncbi:MAG: flagellar assembly protein FliW [Longimicrobiales bacterium]